MASKTKWVDMMWTKVGDGEVRFFRTKRPGVETENRKAGYGYFLLLRFKSSEGEVKRKEIKLPLRLVTYLKQKLAEYKAGTFYISPAFSQEDADFALVKYAEVDPCIQLQVSTKPASSQMFLNMSLADLIKLTMCLEVLGLLISRQKYRQTAEEYGSYVKDIIGWCTAKQAQIEAQRIHGAGNKIVSEAQLMGLMSAVKNSRYHEFYECLAKFITEVKVRIPIHDETSEYDEGSVGRGFLYTQPEQDWEPVQLLVNMINESEFPDKHFGDCC